MPTLIPAQWQSDLIRSLIQTSPQGVVVLDPNNIVKCWNPVAEETFGISKDEATNRPVDQLLTVECLESLRFAEHQIEKTTGATIDIEQSVHVVVFGNETWTIVYLIDVTVRREHERRLTDEALTDPLSGLANRRGFQIKLEEALAGKLTLAILDTDHFKQINDQYGHEAGDIAIQKIASELVHCFPEAVCCARLGGDEFGVLLKTISQADIERQFENFRQRITSTKLGDSTHPGLPEFSISVSVGVSLSNVGGTSARELLTTADRTMYKAKKAGRNQIHIQPINV